MGMTLDEIKQTYYEHQGLTPIETPFGYIMAWPTSWGLILDASSNSRYITVNGVDYATSIRYHFKDDKAYIGSGTEGDPYESIHMQRAFLRPHYKKGGPYANAAKDSVKLKTAQALLPLAEAFFKEHPEQFKAAAIEQAKMERDRLKREMQEKQQAFEDAQHDYQEADKAVQRLLQGWRDVPQK